MAPQHISSRARFARWAVLLLGVVLVALPLAQHFLVAPLVREALVGVLNEQLGLRTSVGGIGGSYLASFEMEDLRTLEPGEGAVVGLDLAHLRLTYNPIRLLFGLGNFLGAATVEVEGLTLALQTGAVEEPEAQKSPEPGPGFALPGALPAVEVRDSEVVVTGPDRTLLGAVRGLRVHTLGGGSRRVWEIEAEGLEAPLAALKKTRWPLSARLAYAGSVIRLQDLRLGEELEVPRAEVDLTHVSSGKLSWEGKIRVLEGEVQIEGLAEGTLVEATLDASGLEVGAVRDLVELSGPEMAGTLSAKAEVQLDTASAVDSHGRLAVGVQGGSYRGLSVESANLEAELRERVLRIPHLVAKSETDTLVLREVSAPLEPILAGAWSDLAAEVAGTFQVEVGDLPDLLAALGLPMTAEVQELPSHRLAIRGSVAEGKVRVADGELTSEAGVVTGSGELRLPVGGVTLGEAPVKAAFSAEVSDLAALSRLLDAPELRGTLEAQGRVDGTLGAPEGEVSLSAGSVAFRDQPVGDVTLSARVEGSRVAVQNLEVRQGGDRLSARGTVDWEEHEVRGVRVEASIGDVGLYVQSFLPELGEVRGALEAEMSLEGGIESLAGTADLTLTAARYGGVEVDRARLDLEGEGRRIDVRAVELVGPEGRAALRGEVSWSAGGSVVEALLADLTVGRQGVAMELERPARIRYTSSERLVEAEPLALVRGRDRLRISGGIDLERRSLRNAEIDLRILELREYLRVLPWGGLDLGGHVEAKIRARGPWKKPVGSLDASAEELSYEDFLVHSGTLQLESSGDVLRVDEARFDTTEGVLAVKGEAERLAGSGWDLRLRSLHLERREAALDLQRPAHLRVLENQLEVEDLRLGGEMGGVEVEGVLAPHGSSDLLVDISDLRGNGWLEEFAGERVNFRGLDATLRLKGALGHPELELDAAVGELDLEGAPFPLNGAVEAAYDPKEGMRIGSFVLEGAGGTRLSCVGALRYDPLAPNPFLPGPLDLEAEFEVPALESFASLVPEAYRMGGQISGRASLEGNWGSPEGDLTLEGKNLRLPEEVQPRPPSPLSLEAELTVRESRWELETLRVSSPELELSGEGSWERAPPLKALVRGELQNLEGDLALEAQLRVPDLGWVAAHVDALRRVRGSLHGELSVRGPVLHPAFQGKAKIEEGEIRAAAAVPTIADVTAEATVTPSSLVLERMDGLVGGAPFRLGGEVRMAEGGKPEFDLRLAGENLLLYRDEGVKVRADTDLKVSGPLDSLEITGDIGITDGLYAKNIDLLAGLRGSAPPSAGEGFRLFSLPDPPLRDARFRVRVKTVKPFVVKNNFARGSMRPDLLLGGTGELPVLTGKVYIDPTRVTLPAGTVRVEYGVMRFLEKNPDRPVLDMTAETRMMGYDITLQVSGPYDALEVTLSSVPPLPDDELLLLVLTGKPPESGMRGVAGRRAGLGVASYLGRGLLTSLFGDESAEGEESIADRFDFQVGRGVTRQGEETIEVQFRIGDNILLKNDTLYLRGERDVYGDFNTGVRIVFRFK